MESVDYNYISEPNGNTNLSIIASDLATINECDFDHIIIHLTRSITFSPTDFYKMSVAVELNYSLNEITKNNFKTKKVTSDDVVTIYGQSWKTTGTEFTADLNANTVTYKGKPNVTIYPSHK